MSLKIAFFSIIPSRFPGESIEGRGRCGEGVGAGWCCRCRTAGRSVSGREFLRGSLGDAGAGEVAGFGADEEKVRGVFGRLVGWGQSTAEAFDPQPAPIAALLSERNKLLGGSMAGNPSWVSAAGPLPEAGSRAGSLTLSGKRRWTVRCVWRDRPAISSRRRHKSVDQVGVRVQERAGGLSWNGERGRRFSGIASGVVGEDEHRERGPRGSSPDLAKEDGECAGQVMDTSAAPTVFCPSTTPPSALTGKPAKPPKPRSSSPEGCGSTRPRRAMRGIGELPCPRKPVEIPGCRRCRARPGHDVLCRPPSACKRGRSRSVGPLSGTLGPSPPPRSSSHRAAFFWGGRQTPPRRAEGDRAPLRKLGWRIGGFLGRPRRRPCTAKGSRTGPCSPSTAVPDGRLRRALDGPLFYPANVRLCLRWRLHARHVSVIPGSGRIFSALPGVPETPRAYRPWALDSTTVIKMYQKQ